MKEVDPNTIIALDRTFVYPGDTLDVAIGSNDVNKPIATIKSKIKYTRIS